MQERRFRRYLDGCSGNAELVSFVLSRRQIQRALSKGGGRVRTPQLPCLLPSHFSEDPGALALGSQLGVFLSDLWPGIE